MARTGRSDPLVWLILGAALTVAACDDRGPSPGRDQPPAAAPVAPPAPAKPAPRPRPRPKPAPVAVEPPATALTEEARLAEDAAASGMTTRSPERETTEDFSPSAGPL